MFDRLLLHLLCPLLHYPPSIHSDSLQSHVTRVEKRKSPPQSYALIFCYHELSLNLLCGHLKSSIVWWLDAFLRMCPLYHVIIVTPPFSIGSNISLLSISSSEASLVLERVSQSTPIVFWWCGGGRSQDCTHFDRNSCQPKLLGNWDRFLGEVQNTPQLTISLHHPHKCTRNILRQDRVSLPLGCMKRRNETDGRLLPTLKTILNR